MENPERPAGRGLSLSLIQKLAICATLLAEAMFLFTGGCQVEMWKIESYSDRSSHHYVVVQSASPPQYAIPAGTCVDWGRTIAVAVGILLVGGVTIILLGLVSARAWRSIISSLSH